MTDVKDNILSSVRNVAMYVRKSRGDEDKDLEKHKYVMKEMCKQYKWNYIEYAEIGTGDSIAVRPEFKALIQDAYEGLYDAVLVYDYDRLGRGSGTDQDTITDMLKDNQMIAIVANPFQVLNPLNEQDEEVMAFKGFIANRELKMITKRLQSGKKVSLRMGNWAHGVAPFGYEIDKQLKKLTPHPIEAEVYRKRIVEPYLTGDYSLNDIAWELNRSGIRTRRGKHWSDTTVRYMLMSETHLGHIVFNRKSHKKERKTGKKVEIHLPRSEWVTVKNAHPALKTEDQHSRIVNMLRKRRVGYSGVKKRNALSGLVQCAVCSTTLHIGLSKEGCLRFTSCKECGQTSGGPCDLVEYTISETVRYVRDRLASMDLNQDHVEDEQERLLSEIKNLEGELTKNHEAVERIEKAFEEGAYDIEKMKKRTEERNKAILELEGRLEDMRNALANTKKLDRHERINKIDQLISQINENIDSDKRNKIYKENIASILWSRPTEEDEVEITVNFL